MRLSMIVGCVLLLLPCSALGCYEPGGEQTGWLKEMPATYRGAVADGAEEASMIGLSLAGAGMAALSLVAVALRSCRRARGRVRPVEPDAMDEAISSPSRPGEAWIRVDSGHEWPGPIGAGEAEEALSGALAID